MTQIADESERRLARDPARSVIVQAPAGSGKTELLMQRYLALLAIVDEPEQVLAVTFTRKAAAEMRARILDALRPADPDGQLPETAALAAKALARSEERGWRLFDFPARLRVRTFDSVNSWLSDAAPLSSNGGGTVTEQTRRLYELAARRTLEMLSDEGALADELGVVLRHLDNQADRFIALLAEMLVRRDQWLPLLMSGALSGDARRVLESALAELVARELSQADALLSLPVRAQLVDVLRYAASQNERLGNKAMLHAWIDQGDFPPALPEFIALWRGVAEFALVANKAEFRKSVNKTTGFPTVKDGGDDEMKARAKALLETWAGDEPLAEALHRLRGLPNPCYTDEQWQALAAMIQVLPVAAAQLSLVFAERGETDYTQIAADALQALGTPDEPTGLALRLDYRIQHILIDEFQDTSRAQYRLLEMLTEGWTGDDGRTLLIVGDPMQSIYRFRQAEVSLYMQLWEQGLGNLQLEPVKLTTNFRSAQPIVQWVNETFAALMPDVSDPATGAVQFAPGTPYNTATEGSGVVLHAFEDPPRVDEAAAVADIVRRVLDESTTDNVGILVRTRNQARLIVPRLRELGIRFSGAGLAQPGETAVEQDLMALTRALSHRGDRTAWLALLRAPWCGLTLVDLEALCGGDIHASVYSQMCNDSLLQALSDDGRVRVEALRVSLDEILALRGKTRLRDWIEGAWQRLGGPATLADERDLHLAEQFFVTLDDFDDGGDIAEASELQDFLTAPEEVDADSEIRVHLLTLYKAKGLEYDVVILPALDGTTRGNDKQVIAWHEYQGSDNQPRYLLAPIEATGDDADPVQKLIRHFDNEQAGNERDRLLYVAATRAKRELHLCFGVKRDKDGEPAAPRKGSLIERMWRVVDVSALKLSGAPGSEENREAWLQPMISRLQEISVRPPASISSGTRALDADDESPQEVTFDWAGSDAMRVGSIVHRCLQHIAEQGLQEWSDVGAIRKMLLEAGVRAAGADEASRKVLDAIARTLADEDGRWVLGAHPEAACELPVNAVLEGRVQKKIIDRTFVSDDGVRWIVDYKTSPHEGSDIDAFLAEQKRRYAEQLGEYKKVMQMLEPERKVRTALYFPLQGQLSVYEE